MEVMEMLKIQVMRKVTNGIRLTKTDVDLHVLKIVSSNYSCRLHGTFKDSLCTP